jgi:hypothetical protein
VHATIITYYFTMSEKADFEAEVKALEEFQKVSAL